MPRLDPDRYFLRIADAASLRATCPRLQVGAVLVKDKRVIGTGYNGSPSGQPHCDDVGCFIQDDHCTRTIHAEVNAVLEAGRDARGATLYCNYFPCGQCYKLLLQAGVDEIVYRLGYRDDALRDELAQFAPHMTIRRIL